MYRPQSCPPGRNCSHANTTGPLPPQTLDDVYFCVRSVLTNLTAGLSSAQSTSFVADMVYSAVHRAVADFAATWNDSAPVILPVLPSELLILCLSYLPLRDKIAASHVSRGWRRFMLAAPSLWDTVDTSQARYPCPIDVFRTMVARSGTVRLDVNLRSGWHPHTQVDNWPSLLGQISSRLRSLTISLPMPMYPDFDLFANFYAPVLEILCVESRHAPQALQFPSNGNTLMPRLKHLTLDRMCIPEVFEPMPGLETFEGYCYQRSDMRNLSAMFPRLVSATLSNLSSPVTLPGAVPPSTLISATISMHVDHVDTAVEILRAFTARPQCNVDLSVAHRRTSVRNTVGALAHIHTGPWRLAFQSDHRDSEVSVQRGNDGSFAVTLASRQLVFPGSIIGPETFSQSPFDRIEVLTLSGAPLDAAVLAGAQFPALRELVLVDEDYGPESMIRHAAENGPELAPLRLPALRVLALKLRISYAHTPGECTVRHLHHFVASRLRCGGAEMLLHQITIDHSLMSGGAQCLAPCLPNLGRLASRVLLVTVGGREDWLTLVPDIAEIDDDTQPICSLLDD